MKIVCPILALTLIACSTKSEYHTQKRVSPSVSGVRSDVQRADESTTRALAANDRVGAGLSRSRSYAETIDYKANLLLERRKK